MDSAASSSWCDHAQPVALDEASLRPLSVSLHNLHFTFPFGWKVSFSLSVWFLLLTRFASQPVDIAFLDLAPWLKIGENLVSFTQTESLSQYVFAVVAHFPTCVQLEYLARSRARIRGLPQRNRQAVAVLPSLENLTMPAVDKMELAKKCLVSMDVLV
jgi:hypothetical protein